MIVSGSDATGRRGWSRRLRPVEGALFVLTFRHGYGFITGDEYGQEDTS